MDVVDIVSLVVHRVPCRVFELESSDERVWRIPVAVNALLAGSAAIVLKRVAANRRRDKSAMVEDVKILASILPW